MKETLGFDGTLERFSRGLDTWVPLDSEASFSAMRRSIDVQRKAGEGHSRPRVLLRLTPPKPDPPAAAVVTQAPSLPILNSEPGPSETITTTTLTTNTNNNKPKSLSLPLPPPPTPQFNSNNGIMS